MSLDSLSKGLGSFHISQNQSVKARAGTGTIYTAATTIDSKLDSKRYIDSGNGNVNGNGSTNGKRHSNKFYLVNDQFVDDLFVSRLDRDDDDDDDERSYESDISIVPAQIKNEFSTGANQAQKVQPAPYILDVVHCAENDDEGIMEVNATDQGSVEHKARANFSLLGDQAPQFMPYLRQQRAILREKKQKKKEKRKDKPLTKNNGTSSSSSSSFPNMLDTSSGTTKFNSKHNTDDNTYSNLKGSIKQEQRSSKNSTSTITNTTSSNNNSSSSSSVRDPQSALVVNTGVGDLSGQILNTFKRQNELRQQSNKTGLIGGERLTTINDNEYSEQEEEDDDEDDDDPAFEAKQIYDNVLRTHGPVFATTTKMRTDTNTLDTSQKLTSNGPIDNELKPRYNGVSGVENLNLITPGSIGYKFKQSKGEWVLENELLNDLSTIHNNTTTTTTTNNFTSATIPTRNSTNTTTGSSTSTSTSTKGDIISSDDGTNGTNNSTGTSTNHNLNFELDVTNTGYTDKTHNTTDNTSKGNDNTQTGGPIFRKPSEVLNLNNLDTTTDSSIINPDITSQIDTPKLKDNVLLMQQLLLQTGKDTDKESHNNNNNKKLRNDLTFIHPSDVTNVSALDITTIKENKHDLVALLTRTLSTTGDHDWTKVFELTITNNPNFKNFVGLSHYLPNLIKINFQHNSLSIINGDIPPTCKLLNLADNDIRTAFCLFDNNNSLEELNLSYNKISPSLQPLANCHNLLKVNLSHNQIKSLDNLGDSRIRQLDLSYNELPGTIDFARVVDSNQNKFGGWLTLEELDLSGNNIKRVQNLHRLPNLKTLKLDGNYGCTLDEISLAKCCEHGLERLSMLNVWSKGSKETDLKVDHVHHYNKRIKIFPKLRELSITGNGSGYGNDTLQILATRCQITSSALTSLTITNCSNATLQEFLNSTVTVTTNTRTTLTKLTIQSTTDPVDLSKLRLNSMFPRIQQLTLSDIGLTNCYELIRYVLCSDTSDSKTSDTNVAVHKIDISKNPLVQRRLLRNGRSSSRDRDGRDSEFLERLRGLLRRCCPEIREIRF